MIEMIMVNYDVRDVENAFKEQNNFQRIAGLSTWRKQSMLHRNSEEKNVI